MPKSLVDVDSFVFPTFPHEIFKTLDVVPVIQPFMYNTRPPVVVVVVCRCWFTSTKDTFDHFTDLFGGDVDDG